MNYILCIIPKISGYLETYILTQKNHDVSLVLLVENKIFNEVKEICSSHSIVKYIFSYTSKEDSPYKIKIDKGLMDEIKQYKIRKTVILDKLSNKRLIFMDDVHQPNYFHLYYIARFSYLLEIKEIYVFFIGGYVNLSFTSLLDDYINIHEGKRAFIIGNGPSLNNIDMTLLKDEITFGTNRGYLGFDKWNWKFKYWTIGDKLQIEEHLSEWQNNNNLDDNIIKFIPFEYKNLLKLNNSCPINFHYGYEGFPKFSTNPMDIYLGHSILYTALQIAVIMGIKELYLVGADHNYDLKNTKEYKNSQIWTSAETNSETHFDKSYNDPSSGRRFITPRPEKQEEAFSYAYLFAKKLGVKILNATPNTKLNAIPTVEFNTLFKDKK